MGTESLREYRPAALWWIGGLFAALLLVGHGQLDQRPFAAVLIAVAVTNVAVAATRRPPLTRTLLLSQSVIGTATVAAVVLYLIRFVGPGPDMPGVLVDFLRASLTDPRTYLHMVVYAVAFAALTTLALLSVSALLGRRPGRFRILAALYAASAVNLACDYAVRRPLYQVSGEPEAQGFFFAAGLFGLESSLPVHLLLLVACTVAYRRSRQERHACGMERRDEQQD